MARGYTDIYLKGGSQDGAVIERVPLRHLPPSLTVPTETYFADTSSGIAIRKRVDDRLGADWSSYSVEVYAKAANEPHKVGTLFKFVGTRDIERCCGVTRQGKRCIKPAKDGVNYCSITHKP